MVGGVGPAVPDGARRMSVGVAVGCLLSLLLLGALMWAAGRGFDFTDEGLYLLWMSNPFGFDASVSQFGFVYHGLYRALDGDVAALRRVNLLLTWAMAAGLFIAISYRAGGTGRVHGWVWALAWAGTGLALFRTGLLTPSYNSLALQGLLVAATGLAMLDESSFRFRSVAPVLLGLGGWLAFEAKPTTAAVLALLVMAYFSGFRPLPWRQLSVAATTAVFAVGLTALGIDGSLLAHLDRFRAGLAMGQAMDAGHAIGSLLRVHAFEMPTSMLLGALVLLLLSAVGTREAPRHGRRVACVAAAMGGIAIAVAFLAGWVPVGWALHPLAPFLLSAIAAGVAFAGLARPDNAKRPAGPNQSSWRRLGLPLVLALLPVAFAFGSASNLWRVAGGAAVFWMAAAWVLVNDRLNGSAALSGVALPAALLVVAALLSAAFQRPYRQPGPLVLAGVQVEIGPGSLSRLLVHPDFARTLTQANEAARQNGLRTRDPVIDLSGQSPGLVYALGASSPGAAWLLGGYRGSENLALMALGRVPCETLAKAWVIAEPGGPRNLSLSVLDRLGLPSSHWQSVGQWPAPALPSDRVSRPPQQLLKPQVSEAFLIASCNEHRARAAAP